MPMEKNKKSANKTAKCDFKDFLKKKKGKF